MLCSRQVGKSRTAAALAVQEAVLNPGSLTVIVAPVQRQSSELFRKVRELYAALTAPVGEPVKDRKPFRPTPLRKLYRQWAAQDAEGLVRESALQMELASGSRIISLPGKEASIRSYTADLVLLDEAARIPDAAYTGAVRPMLATKPEGRLVALSSAYARLGWFYTAWESTEPWERVKVTADQCPRISAAFLAEERAALGARWYAMEYECVWGDLVGALFSEEDIAAAGVAAAGPSLWE
jgi:hypothetical protein